MKRQRSLDIVEKEKPMKRFKTLVIDKSRRRRKFKLDLKDTTKTQTNYVTRYQSKRDNAGAVICKFWKKYKNYIVSNNTENESDKFSIRCKGKNILCPITQEKIPIEKCIKFVSSKGHVHAYNVDDLAQYFKSSGNFTCPCTRENFSRFMIRHMSKKCNRNDAASLLVSFEMRFSIRNRQRERDNRILAIENSCGIAMTESLDICSNLDISTAAAAHNLLNYLIPEWKQLVNDYFLVSKNDCIAMLSGDREKIIRMEITGFKDEHQLVHLIKRAVVEKLTQFENSDNPMSPRSNFVSARSLLPSNNLAFISNRSETIPTFMETTTSFYSDIGRRLDEVLSSHNSELSSQLSSLNTINDIPRRPPPIRRQYPPSLTRRSLITPNFNIENPNNYPPPPAPVFNFTFPLSDFFSSESDN